MHEWVGVCMRGWGWGLLKLCVCVCARTGEGRGRKKDGGHKFGDEEIPAVPVTELSQ